MTSPTISVRRATAGDLSALETIAVDAARPILSQLLAAQDSGDLVVAVAELDGEVKGNGVLDLRESELQPEVKMLWVVADSRRHGLGRRLSTFLEDEARKAGHSARFMAVDPNNEQAIPMVIDLGYTPTGDHKFVEDPDAEQVNHPSLVSNYYAVYRKSLTIV